MVLRMASLRAALPLRPPRCSASAAAVAARRALRAAPPAASRGTADAPRPAEAPADVTEPAWWTVAGKLLHKRRLEERSEVGYARAIASAPAEVVFEAPSSHGNGAVCVTRHGPWLALRFDESEQGLSYTAEPGAPDYRGGAALPHVLGFEYLRVMAAAAAGFCALNGCDFSALPPQPRPRQVLCVGLGAGALPAFLAHHFGGARGGAVQVAEIDPVVIHAVRNVLGLPFRVVDSPEALLQPARSRRDKRPVGGVESADADPAPFEVALADGCAVVSQLADDVATGRARGASLLLLDAYEAQGRIPPHLREPSFLAACGAALAPEGILVANLFNGTPNSAPRKEMAAYARALADAVGPVYSLKVQTQQSNVILVAARTGSPLGGGGDKNGAGPTREALVAATRRVARACGWEYDAGDAAQRMFKLQLRPGGVVESVPGRLIDWPKESSAADHTYAD